MATRKSTANAALTGDVTTIKSNAKQARSTGKASGEIVVSLREEARAEFASILDFERSRVTRWARVIQNHVRVPGDWELYSAEVRLAGVEHLAQAHGFKSELPFKSWPVKAQEQFKSRFAPMFSILSRVGRALVQMERTQVVSLLTDESKSFSQKVQELPKGTKGRKAGGTVAKKVTPVVPPQTAPNASAQAAPVNLSNLDAAARKQAEQELFNLFIQTLGKLPDEWMMGVALQMGIRLNKCLAPEWKQLGGQCIDAITAYKARTEKPLAPMDQAKAEEKLAIPTKPGETPYDKDTDVVEAPVKPAKPAKQRKAA